MYECNRTLGSSRSSHERIIRVRLRVCSASSHTHHKTRSRALYQPSPLAAWPRQESHAIVTPRQTQMCTSLGFININSISVLHYQWHCYRLFLMLSPILAPTCLRLSVFSNPFMLLRTYTDRRFQLAANSEHYEVICKPSTAPAASITGAATLPKLYSR